MKIHNLTILFCISTLTNQSIINSKRKSTPRSLETPPETEKPNYTENEIVYHISQDVLSREVKLDKIFDGRELEKPELDNTKNNFEYEKDENENYIYRENPHSVNDISELKKIDKYINDIRRIIKTSIMKGVIQNPNEDKLQRSFGIYKNLPIAKENFFLEKTGLLKMVSELKDLTAFALKYVEEGDDEGMKDVVSQRDVELDEHNKLILIELLKKLDGFVLEFWGKFYNDYSQAFDLVEHILENEHMSDSEKIAKSIEVSIKISIFEVDVLKNLGDEILEVSQLVLDNPKYHHLSQSFNKTLGLNVVKPKKKGEAGGNVEVKGSSVGGSSGFGSLGIVFGVVWLFI